MSNSKKDFDIAELKAFLEEAYSIGAIKQIDAISCDEEELLDAVEPSVNRTESGDGKSFANSFRVSTAQGEYFLKRTADWIDEGRLTAIEDFLKWTERKKYALSPALIVSTAGETHVQSRENRFQLFDFVTQEKRQIWMRSELSEDDCFQAGGLLARMHLASAEYLREHEEKKFVFSHTVDWSANCETLFHRITSENISAHSVLLSIAKNEDYLKSKFLYAIQLIGMTPNTAVPLLVHGDFHPGNILFQRDKAGSRLGKLVDFDYLRLEHPFFDVCYSLIMFSQVLSFGKSRCSSRTTENKVDWRFGKAFLRGYLKPFRKNPADKLDVQIQMAELIASFHNPRFLQYTTLACFLILDWAVEKLISGPGHFSDIYADVIAEIENLICYELGEEVLNVWVEALLE